MAGGNKPNSQRLKPEARVPRTKAEGVHGVFPELLKTLRRPLYNSGQSFLPGTDSNSNLNPKPRRGTIFAAGLLLVALSLVVLYTSRVAFLSPIALVVVAAIGLAALLLQLRLRRGLGATVRAPLGLNILGIILAVAAVLADMFHLSAVWMLVPALGAVVSFAISGIFVLSALRKPRT